MNRREGKCGAMSSLQLMVLLFFVLIAAEASRWNQVVGAQSLLTPGVALYPRAVELPSGAIIASVVSFSSSGAGVGQIFRSLDGGEHFSLLSTIADPAGANGLCCATLYRLPRKLGKTLPQGALLWAGSFGASNRPMSIRAWISVDEGVTWSFLATVVETSSQLGLWEPEFSLPPSSSSLLCYYSDETQQPAHSQVLARTETTNGTVWSAPQNIVASPLPFLRPGMANVRELSRPGGGGSSLFIMSYEVCGSAHPFNCAVHIRNSSDGIRWGDESDMGHTVVAKGGAYFCHTPVIAASGETLLLTAQVLRQLPSGDVAPGSGSTYFASQDPFGPPDGWATLRTPVDFVVTESWWCPNYSPAFLVAGNGTVLVEISSQNSTAGGVCQSWTGTKRLT